MHPRDHVHSASMSSGATNLAPWSRYSTGQLLEWQKAIAEELISRFQSDQTNEPSPTNPDLEKFQNLFIFTYRGTVCYKQLMSLLQNPKYNKDKDRARLAWAIYNSDKLLWQSKPNTFKKWLQLCNDLLHWNLKTFYDPTKLTPNKLTTEIAKYL